MKKNKKEQENENYCSFCDTGELPNCSHGFWKRVQSQKNKIREYIETGQKLSAMEALKLFGCARLAARINEFRKSGMNIKTELVTDNKKTFAIYQLNKEV